jgi:hypothetical protein
LVRQGSSPAARWYGCRQTPKRRRIFLNDLDQVARIVADESIRSPGKILDPYDIDSARAQLFNQGVNIRRREGDVKISLRPEVGIGIAPVGVQRLAVFGLEEFHADIVEPHHCDFSVLTWNFESLLEGKAQHLFIPLDRSV